MKSCKLIFHDIKKTKKIEKNCIRWSFSNDNRNWSYLPYENYYSRRPPAS